MIPRAMDRVEAWRRNRRTAGRMLFALDFDGTLAPIVEHAEQARPLPAAERALRRLAARTDSDVAIISGRALEDVRARVPVEGIFYAGNHGMEIEGPHVERLHPEAAEARPRLAACVEALRSALGSIEGVAVEDKGLTFSVHYRRVRDAEDVQRVRETSRELCGAEPGLRMTEGKKVLEVRPDIDWDKGRATRYLLDVLQAGRDTLVPAVFIGDDRTDEDAFRELRGQGDGVVVAATPPGDTAATAYVRSPDEVATLLDALADPD